MEILPDQLKEIIKLNNKSAIISKAVNHEARLKFHIETDVENNSYQRDSNEFLLWVKSLLPLDKYETFLSLFRYPLNTNETTEKIFNQLERVFEAKNPFFDYQFTNPELKVDWAEYRTDVLHENVVWRTKGWEYYKVGINSVLIVDLPQDQEGNKPEPYFYWLDISNVLDYRLREDNEHFEYIIFRYKDEKNKVAIFDDKYYRVVNIKGAEVVSVEIETEHNLGYVPAKFFWTTPLKKSIPDLKRADVSNQLSGLDTLLFKTVSKNHLDLYASYPIMSGYEADCDYELDFGEGANAYTDICDRGYIKRDGNYVTNGTDLLKCPRCSKNSLAGAGSFVEVAPPSDANDFKDLRDPVSIVTVDTDSLDYNKDEVIRLNELIINNVVGGGGEPKNDQAKNTKQIAAGFEEKTTILQKIAWNFERAQRFVNDTICDLRYGDAFLGSEISWGKEFYIYSVNELRDLYKAAKENGLSMTELDLIQKQIISTEYRNNPTQLKRASVLMDLEPFRHLTLAELRDLKTDGLVVNDETLQLKLNFSNFIDKFERENTNIVEFGSLLNYDKKIDIIKKTLESYGKPVEPIKKDGEEKT